MKYSFHFKGARGAITPEIWLDIDDSKNPSPRSATKLHVFFDLACWSLYIKMQYKFDQKKTFKIKRHVVFVRTSARMRT